MSFTPEELAEMAAADAEIEREFVLSRAEMEESRLRDLEARSAGKPSSEKKARDRKLKSYAKNREANRERARRYYAEHREAMREYQRWYYQTHKDEVDARTRRWREANKELVRQRNREWKAANRAKKAALLLQQESGQPEEPATKCNQSITRKGGKSNAQSDINGI